MNTRVVKTKKLLAAFAVLAVAFIVLAAVPAVVDDSDAAVEAKEVKSLDELEENVSVADFSLKLTADLETSKTLEIKASGTLDLNGHTISDNGETTGSFWVIDICPNINVTINNGKVEYKTHEANAGNGAIVTNSKITLNNVTVNSTEYGVYVATNGTAIVKDCNIVAGYGAVTGNGTQSNAVIDVDGGTYTSTKSVVAFLPSTKTFDIRNATLTGVGGIDARAGETTLENVTINLKGASSGVGNSGPADFNVGIGIYTANRNDYGNPSVTLQDVRISKADGTNVDAEIYYGTLVFSEESFSAMINGAEAVKSGNHYANLIIKDKNGRVQTGISSTEANTSMVMLSIDGKKIFGDAVLDKVAFVGDATMTKDDQTITIGQGASFSGALTYSGTTAKLELTGGNGGLKVAAGSLTFGGEYTVEESETSITITEGTAVFEEGMTIPEGTDVRVEAGASLEFKNAKSPYINTVKYAEGAKVVIDRIEYTVHHYISGDIDVQYGVSCGDVYYTGEQIDEFDVSVISISLDDKYLMTNKTFSVGDAKIINAGTYKDALRIQLTFVQNDGQGSNITVNLKMDLVVKPAILDIVFNIPEEIDDVDVSDFQKITINEKTSNSVAISGLFGYYNLNGFKGGYYLVIKAQVVDKEGELFEGAKIITEEGSGTNGIFKIYLGATPEEAQIALSALKFTVESDSNHSKPVYTIVGEPDFVAPMEIDLLKGEVLGADASTLYGEDLEVVRTENDAAVYDVSGELLWKAGYTGWSSIPNEQRGWYLGVVFSNENGSYEWSSCSADLKVVGQKEDVKLDDGEFVFRITNINADPTIVLKDVNGFKTKYVLNIDGIEFGTATGYGDTKAEAEAAMRDLGIDASKLTDDGSDVIDKTMFMIFNSSAYRGKTVTATATSQNDDRISYSEELEISSDITIWYFSFEDQFEDGVAGFYDLRITSEETAFAAGEAVKKGVYVFDSGFYADAGEAKTEIKKFRSDINDVDPNTFFMIAGIYGYDEGTKISAQMITSEGEKIIKDEDVGAGSVEIGNDPNHKYAFYFSFDNSSQVEAPEDIFGEYTMKLKQEDEEIASVPIPVATGSTMKFSVAENVDGKQSTIFGADLNVVLEEDSTFEYVLSGSLNYINEGEQKGYFFPISMIVEGATENTTLTLDGKTLDISSGNLAMLLEITSEKKTFEVVVDFDGVGKAYKQSTYTLTFNGTVSEKFYGILLADSFYGQNPVLYKDAVIIGKGIVLPNGPDASKDFIGWMAEDEETIYSAGAFVVISDAMDCDGDGNVTFTAVYKGSLQRDWYTMKAEIVKVNDGGSVLVINTTSDMVDGYRNLSSNHYYIVTVVGADHVTKMDKAIASPSILNGGNTYSEEVCVVLDKYDSGCSVIVQFKTDYAMGLLQISEPAYLFPESIKADSGFKTGAGEALEAINGALKKQGRDDGISQSDVESNTAYAVFATTENMNGDELTAYLYDSGENLVYAEKMVFSKAGPHVWFFSFNDGAPSHIQAGDVVKAMATGTVPSGEYTIQILNSLSTLIIESSFSIASR